jgi:hypothetical protein
VRATGELAQHARRVVTIGRLAVDPAVQDDGCIDAERHPRGGGDGASLSLRVRPNELGGIKPRRIVLDVLWSDNLEGNPELLENRTPLWRRRGQHEHVAHDRKFRRSSEA